MATLVKYILEHTARKHDFKGQIKKDFSTFALLLIPYRVFITDLSYEHSIFCIY